MYDPVLAAIDRHLQESDPDGNAMSGSHGTSYGPNEPKRPHLNWHDAIREEARVAPKKRLDSVATYLLVIASITLLVQILPALLYGQN